MSTRFVGVRWKEKTVHEVDLWKGNASRSSFTGRLLEAAIRAGLQLEGLQVEHAKGGGVSRVFVRDGSKLFPHEVRAKFLEGRHVFAPLQCEACRALRESFGGRP